MHLLGGDRFCCHYQALRGLFLSDLPGTIDICKMTHLDTSAPCGWSVPGLAEEKVLREMGQ